MSKCKGGLTSGSVVHVDGATESRSIGWYVTALAVGSLVFGVPGPGFAARWSVTPLIILSETYTDNVALAAEGLEKEEYVTELTPGLIVQGEGSDLSVDVDMRWQYLAFSEESDRNTSNFILNSSAIVELSPDTVFIDFEAQHRQEIISTREALPISAISDTNNLADVTQYSVGPRIEKQFGRYAQLSAAYRYSEFDYERDVTSDSVVQSAAFDARGGDDPIFNWRWIVSFDASVTEREGQDDDEREDALIELGRWITPRLVGLARVGYTDDSIGPSGDFENGSYWALGVEWLPIDRMQLRLLYGDRDREASLRYLSRSRRTEIDLNWRDLEVGASSVIGTRFTGAVRYSGQRSNWAVRYTEENTNEQIIRLADTQTDGDTVIEDPITGEPTTPETNLFSLTSDNFIRTRWNISTGYEATRSSWGIGIFEEERKIIGAAEQEIATGVSASWRWRFKPFTSLLLRGEAERNEFDDGREDDLSRYDLGVLHEFSHSANVSFVYRRAERESTEPTAEFMENRLTLGFEKRF